MLLLRDRTIITGSCLTIVLDTILIHFFPCQQKWLSRTVKTPNMVAVPIEKLQLQAPARQDVLVNTNEPYIIQGRAS